MTATNGSNLMIVQTTCTCPANLVPLILISVKAQTIATVTAAEIPGWPTTGKSWLR